MSNWYYYFFYRRIKFDVVSVQCILFKAEVAEYLLALIFMGFFGGFYFTNLIYFYFLSPETEQQKVSNQKTAVHSCGNTCLSWLKLPFTLRLIATNSRKEDWLLSPIIIYFDSDHYFRQYKSIISWAKCSCWYKNHSKYGKSTQFRSKIFLNIR